MPSYPAPDHTPPHPGEVTLEQSPAPWGETGWVTSQARATRNHPIPEPPGRAQRLPPPARLPMTFLAPRRHAGEQPGCPPWGCPGSGPDGMLSPPT